MRAAQSRRRAGLAREAGTPLGTVHQARVDELDGHFRPQYEVLGDPNRAHAATPELVQERELVGYYPSNRHDARSVGHPSAPGNPRFFAGKGTGLGEADRFRYPARVRFTLLALVVTTYAAETRAESWSDTEPEREPSTVRLSAYDLELGVEYRAVGWHTNALDLGEQKATLLEQRLRLGAALEDDDALGLVISADLVDGALWGSATPRAASSRFWLSEASGPGKVGVAYRGSGDPGDPNSYRLALVPGEWAALRRLYGELPTPLGVVRLGRQPAAEGNSILYPDGDGNPNRFGYPGHGVFADRAELTTNLLKPLERSAQATSDRGLLLTTYLDRLATGDPVLLDADLARVGARVRLLAPLPTVGEYFDVAAEASYGWHARYGTEIGLLRACLDTHDGAFGAGGEALYVTGRTRESSSALSALAGEPPGRQLIQQWGARAVVRWDESWWTAYLELDYASGDGDPSPSSRLGQFCFAPDASVGLLLFPRVLAFESARSRAAAASSLAAAGLPTRAAERLDTQGAFTNATALYPQVDLRLLDSLALRWGALIAWTPDGLVDPARALGPERRAERLNYRGGKPGHFYGVELDGRMSWRPAKHFAFDLEGAILMPGDALADAQGQADSSALVEGRAAFAF
jgi:hypothetical protein